MARAAVIGEPLLIEGYGLVGGVLCPADDRAAALRAWRDLPADVVVAVLTPAAAEWIDAKTLAGRPDVLPVAIPDDSEAGGGEVDGGEAGVGEAAGAGAAGAGEAWMDGALSAGFGGGWDIHTGVTARDRTRGGDQR